MSRKVEVLEFRSVNFVVWRKHWLWRYEVRYLMRLVSWMRWTTNLPATYHAFEHVVSCEMLLMAYCLDVWINFIGIFIKSEVVVSGKLVWIDRKSLLSLLLRHFATFLLAQGHILDHRNNALYKLADSGIENVLAGLNILKEQLLHQGLSCVL